VQNSAEIVWFRKRRHSANHIVKFSYGGSLLEPRITRSISSSELVATAKWTGLASNGVCATSKGPVLGDFFSIKRGLATGDNRFFIMTPEQIRERNLPMEFFTPILPGPRHLPSDIVDADSAGCPKLARQLFMLDCRLSENEIKRQSPELFDYLQSGKPTVSETY